MLKSNYKNKVWSRLTWLWTIACLLSFTSGNIYAQCTNTSAYGSSTAPTAGGSATISCQYAGEYGTISTVAAGAYFKSTSTVATDYCTVRQGSSSGTLIASGAQPLYWQATVAGTYYIHWNTNAACGTQNSCRNVTITSMVGCTNASAYGSVIAPTNTTPAVVNCQYAGEYATVTSVQAGKTYVSGSTVATDYFTIHQGSASGPIVAAGAQPLTWTAAGAGTYYMHCNTNAACGTQSSCRNTSIYCNDCVAPCTGTPAPGNTISSSASVCSGVNFNLSFQNTLVGSGITYQWQSSPDDIIYTNIALATNSTLTTSQAAATYYKCLATCSGNTGASTPLQVNMASSAACLVYCVGTASCTGGDHITNVNFNSGAINNSTGACLGSGGNSAYSDYRSSIVAPSVQAAGSYSISVSVNNGGTEYAAAWIDLDHSGTFDASEFMNIPLTLATTWNGTVSYAIPSSALSGQTVLRLRSRYSSAITSTDACTAFSYGETEDYLINITPAPTCTGTPAPGNTVSSANPACASTNFTLSLEFPPAVAGVTYDWQSSPDGATWTSTGGTGISYTTSQTVATYYQCVVTCTTSGLSATSTPLQVTMNSFLNCYCTPSHQFGTSGGFYGPISNVTLNTLNNTSSYPAALPYYTDYPASGSTTTTVVAGATYNMSISSQYYWLGAWFDWNQNGIFETTEYTSFGTNSSGSVIVSTQAITVPVTAVVGQTKMRVNSEAYFYSMSSASACGPFFYGETEDYTVTVLVAGNCSGAPSASVTTASVSNLCPGGSVTLGTNPLYTDAGITYDWQSSPDGVTYTSTGSTTSLYTVTGFSASTYYQCVVTCTNSGGSSITSTPVQVTLNPFYNCYCSITNAGGSCLTNVTLNTLNHTTPGCENSPSNYTVVPIGTATTSVYQGFAYNLSVTTDGGAIESVWIDYDHSGTFDATEWAQVTTSSAAGTPSTISLTIPVTALTGNTGMRIRSRATGNQNGAGDACLAMGSGESQDYTIDIQTPAGCTGTPAPGSTSSTSGSLACSAQPFTLSMPGLTFTTGLTYQWFSSPDGVTYAAVSGETNSTLTTSQTAATYYYCDVTCTNSGLTGSSTALNLGMNSFVNCYCTPNSQFGTSGGFYGVISNVTFNTLNNTSTYPSVSPYYTNYPVSAGTTTTVVAGATYNMDITSGNYNWAGAWFDWNQNGLFESSEFTSFGNNSTGSVWTGTQAITVPTGAVAGTTKMRVRTEYYFNAFSGTDACTLLQYGESEDYTITVNPAVACSGSPAAATTTSTANPICSGINFTLAPNTLYTEAGLTYDWQSSPDGITYTSTGVTTQLYTVNQIASTYYQLVVTCTNGGLSTTTTPLQVTMNSLANCYCVAGATTDGIGTSNEYVGNVTLNTINNTSTNPAAPANQYSDFTSISTSLQIGNTYIGEVLISNYFSGDQAAIWIDFNQDGTFNTTTEQFILSGGASGVAFTGSITIPGSAVTGSTRMRVRGNYTGAMSPCGITTYGEVEDYTVNIAAPTCILAPTYPANGSNGCPDGSNITLSWPALSGATGYDVYVGTTDPPTTLVSNNQAGTTYSADISGFAPTYYWMVVPQIAGGGVSCTVWSFGLNAAPEPMAGSGGDPCEGTTLSLSADNNAAGQSSGNTYAWSGPASYSSTQQNPSINNATGAIAGTYTVVVTNAQLCTASATVEVAVNPNPVATVSSFQNVGCIGGSDGEVTIAGNTVGPYQYSNDGSNYNSTPTFTGLPTGPGTYYLVDGNNCQATPISKSLTFISTVPPSANVIVPFIGMPVNVCNGTSVVISIPAVSNTTKYIWDAPTGAYFNGNPFNVSPFTTTTPSVQVTYGNPTGSLYETGVQAANGCGASLRKVQKSRGAISVPTSVSGATTRCAGTTDTYTTPAVTAASSYEWTITGDATVTGTGTTATVTFGPAWTGGTLCVAAKTSCYKTPTKCITIGTSTSLLNAISGSFTACPNQTLTYSVPASTGAASYNWSLPSGATGSSTTNSISAAFGAGYSAVGSVCVNVTSICGVTSATKCKTVAPGLPAQPSSISGALSGVCNQTIVYDCPPVSGTTYNWTTPSGTIIQSGQGTSNISAHFSNLTTGNVCVTATNSCGSSIARCVPVKGAPNAPGAITPTPSSWCAGDQIEFAVNTSSMSGAFTLNWAYPPASVATYVIGGGNSNSLILDWIGGSGAVNVTASNACGGATKPSTWSSSCREGAIAEVNALSVSPNPTTGILNISYTATKGHTRLMVLDLAGRVVMNEQIASIEGSNNTQLDMSRLAKGAYMLSVQSTQGNKQVRVVVE